MTQESKHEKLTNVRGFFLFDAYVLRLQASS